MGTIAFGEGGCVGTTRGVLDTFGGLTSTGFSPSGRTTVDEGRRRDDMGKTGCDGDEVEG